MSVVGSFDDTRAARAYANWVQHPGLLEHPTQPERSYFLCGTPRSGTWLLSGLLASSGVAGRPHEWFLPEVETRCREEWNVDTPAGYLQRVLLAGTTPNGVLGVKLMWGYLGSLLARLGRQDVPAAPTSPAHAYSGRLVARAHEPVRTSALPQITRHFPNPQFVWIQRQDVTAQAVSWAKALQTQRWQHWGDPVQAPVYNREQVAALLDNIAAGEAGWRGWFFSNEIEPVKVSYEDLAADTVGVAGGVVQALGIAADAARFTQQTVKLTDDANREWISRYRNGSD